MRRAVQGSMASRRVRLAHALFIVPQAHVRFDAAFQGEMYELFHRRPLARYGHLICTPLINVALLALLALAIPGTHVGPILVDGALAGAIAIALWSLHV